jgi:effector-binding domain-containing protein
MQGMFRLKRAELQQNIQDKQEKLVRVEVRLNQIEKEGIMSNYDVVIKRVEPIQVVSIRDIIPSYFKISSLFDELAQYLQSAGVSKWGYPLAIWHDPGYKESDVDGEAAFVIDTTIEGSNLAANASSRIKVYELTGYDTMASIVHHGSYKTLRNAYQNIISWIELNGYRCIAPNREIYLEYGPEPDSESYVTEIVFPVERD